MRVKVMADEPFRERDPRWAESARGLLEAASDFYEREFGIKFVAEAVAPWALPEPTRLTAAMLADLKKAAPLSGADGSYDLVIAFTGAPVDRLRGRARVDRIGNCADGLGNYVVSYVSRPFRYGGPLQEPTRDVIALVHELGHIFGAAHVHDPLSIMHEHFDYRSDFDAANREIILRNKFCPFAGG
ncbi:MAG TPA: M12 family metallo-peptidase [Candidatus Acidoferrales bacterium]|nr:M12 family metallo-peptidase [Candidatus Acidoferrales bacterium]